MYNSLKEKLLNEISFFFFDIVKYLSCKDITPKL